MPKTSIGRSLVRLSTGILYETRWSWDPGIGILLIVEICTGTEFMLPETDYIYVAVGAIITRPKIPGTMY